MTGPELKTSCTQASNSAPGMDGWAPADFAFLSDYTFTLLADLLNHIEMGAP